MTTAAVKRRSQALEFAATILTGLDTDVDDNPPPADAAKQPDPAIVRGTPERYEIVGTLGEGGMGRVLDATDLWFGRRVALKEIRGETAPASVVQRFLVEALVTGNLEHPGIVAVHERGIRDGRPYYVMRKLGGRTIADALNETKSLRERLDLVPKLVRVAETIAFAHEHGVIHRDLKPENVVLGTHGEVTVIDWGIARIRELDKLGMDTEQTPWLTGGARPAHTIAGSVLGTPAYMAPEQAQGLTEVIDERTDVFALGALLYHVLSGRPPFDGANLEMQLVKATAVDCPAVASIEPKAPPALVAICERAMAKDPGARFRSAAELAVSLNAALTDALTQDEPWYLKATARAVGVVCIAAFVFASFATWRSVPTFEEMGPLAFPCIICGTLGILCGLAELVTKARYRLSSLTLAFALLAFLAGLTATLVGAVAVLRAMSKPAALGDVEHWRRLATEGAYEAVGGVTAGTAIAAAVLVLWLVARLREVRTAPAR